jgi:hypothetical protein
VQKGQAALIGRKRDKLLLIGCKRDKLLLIGCKRDKLLLITIQMKREQDGLYRGVRHMSRLEVGLGEWTSMWISLIRHVCTYITGHPLLGCSCLPSINEMLYIDVSSQGRT